MKSLLNAIIILVTIGLACTIWYTLHSLDELIRLKGTPAYQRWRKRTGGFRILDRFERFAAIALIAVSVIVIVLFIVWGKAR